MSVDWQELILDDIIKKRNQGVNTTTERVEYSTYGIPVIRANNITQGSIDFSDTTYVDIKTFERIKEPCKPRKGDVLYTNIGSQFGNAAKVEVDFDFVIAWNVLRIQPAEMVDADFLVYLLNIPINKACIQSLNSSSTMAFVSGKEIGKIVFKIPQLYLQKRISKKLKGLDTKIQLNHQISGTLEQIAQAIFKSWFVDFDPVKAKMEAKEQGRDPERAAMCAISGKTEQQFDELSSKQLKQLADTTTKFPDEFEQMESGLMPKGWGCKALYDTAEYINGAVFKDKDFSLGKEGLPIIKISELKQGVNKQTKYTKNEFNRKFFIDNGDVLYSWSGSPETSIEVFKWFGGKDWLNQHIFKLNFKSSEEKYFTYYLLKRLKPFLVHTAKNKQTTGLGHITIADMKRIKTAFPPSNVLKRFAQIIGPLYEQDSLLQIQNCTLRQFRDELLPKLLSGELPFYTKRKQQ